MLIIRYRIKMGRHSEWRKVAKRERRRRVRTLQAKERDKLLYTENYMQEQNLLEDLLIEQINKQNEEENRKWVEAELVATTQWLKLQQYKARLQQEKLEKQAKIKLEWELEQKKRKLEEERLKAAQEELIRKQEMFMENLDMFLSGDAVDPPPELKVIHETKPDAELCPFFAKTACCRFGDECSRNHKYPGISKVLLATNFYTHFGLNSANLDEYDTDIMLEYEESETYKEFKEFFYDVLSEFEKFGKVVQFKVCYNHEKHLRGNTYIEFAELRCAVTAYRALHTRWYGGRQLSLEFCRLMSWKNAVCGSFLRNRCPKGRACNFLHVFKNPKNLFDGYDEDFEDSFNGRTPRSARSWRWSESPEREDDKRSRRSDRSDRRRSRRYDEDSHRSHRRSSPRRSSRR
ncbi:U2 small nuclear ribonucleoprotein auxiliary factor 35 kDa subunit-related protein 2 [Trichoplusia ni]|uniref:U2 small nuclear ribonucleoprotein auxiliary factor 35 kDa subunit-related protein 2 n=1 Tax=Trichoplusia ni TaxID=7111 RepID=A0A7E5WC06_TRINI|nr:U2 small nuclear ribonucleoprotein auxiliary factor 35 kDa subunit-related protein 2 [Trichoplusia ni]